MAGGDFTQGDDSRFMAAGFHEGGGTGGDLAGTISGGQRQVEAIGNTIQAVIYGNAGHVGSFR